MLRAATSEKTVGDLLTADAFWGSGGSRTDWHATSALLLNK